MCMLVCHSCDAECLHKGTKSVVVLNIVGVAFAVTVEDFQVWWKSVHKRFGKLTGHHSGNGAHNLTRS